MSPEPKEFGRRSDGQDDSPSPPPSETSPGPALGISSAPAAEASSATAAPGGSGEARRAGRRAPIRTRLLWLVAACVVPVWIAAGFLVYFNYQTRRALVEQRMLDTARALTMAVDGELNGTLSDAQMMAGGNLLVSGDLPAFYQRAREYQRTHSVGVMVTNASGQRLLYTPLPFGTFGVRRNPWVSQQVFATGKPVISDVFRGLTTDQFLISVDVPVFRDGKVIYALGMSINAERFAEILRQQRLPGGWQGRVFDSHQIEIASTRPGNPYVGRQASFEPGRLGTQIRDRAEGIVESKNFDGELMVSGFSRSATTGWTVSIAVPRAEFTAHMRRWLIGTIAGTALLSLLGLGLALPIWRRVERTEREASRLGAIVESSDEAIVGSSLEAVIESWSRGAQRLFGYEAGEVVGRSFTILVPEEQQEVIPERIQRIRGGESIGPFRTVRKHKDGRLIPVEVKLFPVSDSEGRIVGRAAILRDITEHMQWEQALAESEEKLRAVVELAPDSVFMARQDRFLMVNQAMCDQLGYPREQLLQMRLLDIIAPRLREGAAERLLEPNALVAYEGSQIRADGVELPVEVSHRDVVFRGQPIMIGIARDISGRKRAEQQREELELKLRQAQKMEAIGQLAGGIAHEFNNLLMVIQSYAETLEDKLPAYGGLRKNTQAIKNAAERAATLTRQMLAFSRKQMLMPVLLDLNGVIGDTAKLLVRLIGEDVEFRIEADESLWAVEADAGQVVQVLMNLSANARDAMPLGGKLTIATGNLVVGPEGRIVGPMGGRVAPGEYVWFSVADTGTGMNDEVREHIFEPFFTTKEVGRGTGLGLATVFGIVKQSAGYIDVKSEAGKGACFTIYLPRATGRAAAETVARVEEAPKGAERLLLVEDEAAVRQVMGEYLQERGYTVLAAEDGQQALVVASECKDRIDLLITDLVMPGQSGLELAQTLQGLRPGLKTIYMSGHPDDAIARHGGEPGEAIFLQKPFTLSALARKLRDALG